ncbi:MAG: ferritin-like domain-containing protein [Oscillospiraceae bacterium]|nr:ferritin-like domain-containing protein [Oscillospiraceae bacterium]
MELEPSVRPGEAEQFARVWSRVTPEEIPGSAVQLVVHEPPAVLEPLLPLGEESEGEGDALRRYIVRELQGWKSFQALAGSGAGSTPLKSCGAEELRHAKRLSAVYFLISGVRYLPVERAAGSRWSSREQGLRAMFQASQRAELEYRRAAEETRDPALSSLYLELSREEAVHLARIRLVLEETL